MHCDKDVVFDARERHPPRPRRMDQVPRHLLQRGGQGQPRLLAREGGLRRHQGSRHGRRRASRGHKAKKKCAWIDQRQHRHIRHSRTRKHCIQAEVLHRRRHEPRSPIDGSGDPRSVTTHALIWNTALADVDVIIDESIRRDPARPHDTKAKVLPMGLSASPQGRRGSPPRRQGALTTQAHQVGQLDGLGSNPASPPRARPPGPRARRLAQLRQGDPGRLRRLLPRMHRG